jgi:quercetin dioxygenase-like cupin family protein
VNAPDRDLPPARNLPPPRNTSMPEMLAHVARFAELRGSSEAFVDSRLPGCARRKINIVGNGVVERTDIPDLNPNIKLAAHGFNLGMIQCEPGNGTALHNHKTEEVFMPLIGPWVVTFMTDAGQQEIRLEPFDTVHIPVGVYRGFRYVGESGTGTLMTLIGGPDPGKVDWVPEVYTKAAASGLERDAAGNLIVTRSAA